MIRVMLSPERASVLRRDGRVAIVVEGEPATWVVLDGEVVLAATCCDREHDAFQIDSCWCNGTVVVDAVMVQVLPVLHWTDKRRGRAALRVRGDGKVFIYIGLYGGTEVDLPSTPRPGVDWVVVLTMLSDGSPSARSDNAVQLGGGAA